MTTLVLDESGYPVCDDCMYHCPRSWPCEVDGCQCGCRDHTEALCPCETQGGPGQCVGATCARDQRARELDDRPDETLANIARDVEAEKQAGLEELRRERFGLHGWPRRGAA